MIQLPVLWENPQALHLNRKAARAVWKQANESLIEVTTDFSLGGYSLYPILKGRAVWRFDGRGAAALSVSVEVREDLIYLPRFGLKLEMPGGTEEIEYSGFGPHESYIDKHRSAKKASI